MAFLTPPKHPAHSARDLNDLAKSLLATIEQSRSSVRHADRSGLLCQEITIFETAAAQIDPADFSEDDFELVDNDLSLVVDALRNYVEHKVPSRDKVMCEHFAQSIEKLTSARSWIYQGFSPAKPPSDEELRRGAEDFMLRALRDLPR
jgi:hypothetical protein